MLRLKDFQRPLRRCGAETIERGSRVNTHRLLARILRGDVANIAFRDLTHLLLDLGFLELGGRGSHRVFARSGVKELVVLQNEGGHAKPYQVRQVASIIRRYNLRLEEDT